MKDKLRFAFKLVSIFLLAIILFCYSMFQGGFVSWFLFYAYVPILLYVLLVLAYPLDGWRVERSFSKYYVKSGGEVTVEITLSRGLPFPLVYLQIEDLFDKTLLKMSRPDGTLRAAESRQLKQHILFPGFRRHLRIQYVLDRLPRGEHSFHQIRLRTGDPFQLIEKEAVFDISQQLHVYPAEREMTVGNPNSVFEEGAAIAYAPRSKQTSVVSGIREYTPGDRFSWIDWKASARKQDMMTKEFEQEKSADVLVALDRRVGRQAEDLFEYAVVIAFSVYRKLKKRNEQVGFMSLGHDAKWLPATMGSAQLQRVQHYLTTVSREVGRPHLHALAAELSKQPKGSTVYYVTTDLDSRDLPLLRKLRQTGYVLTVLYICSHAELGTKEKNLLQGVRQLGHQMDIHPVQKTARTEVQRNA
ncbi:DUF58 domain-containing protein [Terribacillus sp. 7520-G]|uniref:DUF58 domain-containing protein n=1 Tax=Terribacillus sp. 7520-G TaxID=2025389 RepID=UPI0013040BB0|nr:DUF58 domain-containing protein [Terribacillus sp. 7520-G]